MNNVVILNNNKIFVKLFFLLTERGFWRRIWITARGAETILTEAGMKAKVLSKRFVWVVLLVAIVCGGVWAFGKINSHAVDQTQAIALVFVGAMVVLVFVYCWTRWDLSATTQIVQERIQAEITQSSPREMDDPVWRARVQRDAQKSVGFGPQRVSAAASMYRQE